VLKQLTPIHSYLHICAGVGRHRGCGKSILRFVLQFSQQLHGISVVITDLVITAYTVIQAVV